jgi:small multidrug resistance pump
VTKAYLLLVGAILFEVTGTLALKAADGFSRLVPSVVVVVGYVLSFACLGFALQRGLSVGVSYAIWSAVGTSLIAALGVVLFHESLTPTAIAGIGLIIIGVVLLQLGSAGAG